MKRHIFSNIALALLLLAPVFVSCEDDDNSQSTAMTIEAVYLEDVDAEDGITDRLVTYARPGSLLRIQGSGFKGLKYIYVNGYETYFNNALMTDNNVWVTLDTDTPIEDADDDVRNTIQFVKDATSLTYSFTIRAASPSITRIDNTLPDAGETVIVYGSNLHETETITVPLNKFGDYTNDDYSWTFQNVIDDKNAGSYRNFGIIFCNPDLEYSDDITYASSTFCQEVYMDRFRIVPCQTITVSDY